MEFKIMMKRLHLPLNQESFNKVECGEQTEVYITFNTYWYNKIEPLIHEDSIVVFSYGYTNKRISFLIKDIEIGYGKSEWGAPKKEEVIILKLERRLN